MAPKRNSHKNPNVPAFLHTFTFHENGFITQPLTNSLVTRNADDNWMLNQGYIPPDDVSFVVFQLERCPTTRRLHLQGAIEFVEECSTRGIKQRRDVWNHSTIHWENALNPRETQIEYCTKQETRANPDEVPFQYCDEQKMKIVDDKKEANLPQVGRRGRPELSDTEKSKRRTEELKKKTQKLRFLDDVLNKCSGGLYEMWLAVLSALNDAIAIGDEEKIECLHYAANKIIMNGRSLGAISEELNEKKAKSRTHGKQRQVDVQLYWGPPGRGKTTAALTNYSDKQIYSHKVGSDGPWFCHYTDQPVLILDEMGGTLHLGITPEMLLTWLAGDPVQLQRKGKPPVEAAWFCVIIISNYCFNEWFNCFAPPRFNSTFKAALLSRIPDDHVHHFNSHIDFRTLDENRWTMPKVDAEYKKVSYDEVLRWNYVPNPVKNLNFFQEEEEEHNGLRQPDIEIDNNEIF